MILTMKKLFNMLMLPAAFVAVVACDPMEDRDSMPGSIAKEELVYNVKSDPSNPNSIWLSSSTKGVIPFWDYVVGTSANAVDTVFIPFEGDYWIKYYAYSGGLPTVDSVKLTLPQNLDFFNDVRWNYLANSSVGKTWVLNMDHPLAYYDINYGKPGAENWTWEPELASNSWIMENKDWGQMYFNLDKGYNYGRTMYDADGNPVSCTGKFSFDLVNNMIKLTGCELLYGGEFYNKVSDWKNTRLFLLTDDELRIGVIRDQSPGEDPCYLVWRFKPKV